MNRKGKSAGEIHYLDLLTEGNMIGKIEQGGFGNLFERPLVFLATVKNVCNVSSCARTYCFCLPQ